MNTYIEEEEEEEKEEEDVAQLGPWGVSSKLVFFRGLGPLGRQGRRTIIIIFVVVCPRVIAAGKPPFCIENELLSCLFCTPYTNGEYCRSLQKTQTFYRYEKL